MVDKPNFQCYNEKNFEGNGVNFMLNIGQIMMILGIRRLAYVSFANESWDG